MRLYAQKSEKAIPRNACGPFSWKRARDSRGTLLSVSSSCFVCLTNRSAAIDRHWAVVVRCKSSANWPAIKTRRSLRYFRARSRCFRRNASPQSAWQLILYSVSHHANLFHENCMFFWPNRITCSHETSPLWLVIDRVAARGCLITMAKF